MSVVGKDVLGRRMNMLPNTVALEGDAMTRAKMENFWVVPLLTGPSDVW